MKVVVTVERRFERTRDGIVWTPSTEVYSFWQRYLEVFDEVHVLGRIRAVGQVESTWERADGPGVSFAAVPYFVGPFQYLRQHRRVKRVVHDALGPRDAAILRAPGTLATVMEASLRSARRPFAVEVAADPHEVFAPESVRHPLRPFFRWWFRRCLRRQCARACAVAYVAGTLQRRYPASADAYAVSCSDIDLGDEAFVTDPRLTRSSTKRFNIVFVGSLEQMYKAPNVLIEAIAVSAKNGLDVRLAIVGDGKHRPELEDLTRECGVGNRVRFAGSLPSGDPVRAELDGADLFVLPSRTEGLPRALVEAMARGLPCVGSNVGGIPELLSLEELVRPGDVMALATKIEQVLEDRNRMARLSAQNHEKAREFHCNTLRPRRRTFYEAVLHATMNL